jgi:hypothetical protein
MQEIRSWLLEILSLDTSSLVMCDSPLKRN